MKKQIYQQSILVIQLHTQLVQFIEEGKDVTEVMNEIHKQENILRVLKMEILSPV